mmetsp:Transcript_18086/g.36313  ORF Transcript_18086/g.36313 Transcript_18086/m.36313 type:complete len:970 (+) Transcript_18086:107-3016(+)
MAESHRFFAMQPLPITCSFHHLLILCTLLLVHPTNSQTNTNWFCGTSAAEASLKCGTACPTGSGCPLGQYCFSGINSCSTTTSSSRYCGTNLEDANAKCGVACPTGKGCPFGQACFLNTICNAWTAGGSSSSSSTTSSTGTIKTFGHAAVEETFQSIKDVINTKLFLYETPGMQWLPSTVYRFDGFFDGLQLMYKQGVNGKKIYMGGNDPDCPHCHMYGLVNIAAFLAQAMKETIRYDACDENSWDRVGDKKMYPIANACGQLGQSYQDYHCKEDERFMECEVDINMSINAVTHAKWWGAPGPLFCGPKTQYPHTGYWDFSYECNNQWANPPESCDVYEGQKGGKHIDDAPYANAAGRTDVEGCCWWGRGVIQTSGVCNFGKLNYFLGKRAHEEGRESRYPDIDFCKDPEAICANENYKELKWIAGFFYWVDQVQPYESDGWIYLDELRKFVDGGMEGDAFINSVSGIVNRGCHNPPCGTGELDGGPERADNFFKILKEMTFAWVDVAPPATPPPTRMPTPLPTLNPTKGETAQPFSLPEIVKEESRFIEYKCGDGVEAGPQTYIDVIFAYELHNELDTAASDALKEAKKLMLDDIARRIGCNELFNRKMQQSESEGDDFSNIIGITSSRVDGLDLDVAGCTEEVQLDTQTTCTPAKGGFALFAKSGTDQNALNGISDRIKLIIEKSMADGQYETGSILKTIYIGDRVQTTPDAINIYSEPEPSKTAQYALYGLIVVCLVLLCLLCMSLRSSRRRARKHFEREDEELAYIESRSRPVPMDYNDEPQHGINDQNLYGRDYYMHSHSQRPRSRSNSSSRRNMNRDDSTRPRTRSSSKGSRREIDQSDYSRTSNREGKSIDFSRSSTDGSHDYPDTRSFRPPPPRSKSTPIMQKQSSSRRNLPPAKLRDVQAEDDSSDESSSSSSESDESPNIPPPPPRTDNTGATSKDERRQRLKAAKARAASRRSARTLT